MDLRPAILPKRVIWKNCVTASKRWASWVGISIGRLDWMGEETRARALEKLHAMRNKVGYPDVWRDYAALDVRPADFLGDVSRAVRFEFRRQMNRIGKLVELFRGRMHLWAQMYDRNGDPRYAVHILQGLFFLFGVFVMVRFILNAKRVEPFTES